MHYYRLMLIDQEMVLALDWYLLMGIWSSDPRTTMFS